MIYKDFYTLLVAERPKVEGSGEDGYTFCISNKNSGYIAVFDGCGGMGAKKYVDAGNHTGAYVASRIASYITDQYYNKYGFKFDGNDAILLKNEFKDIFFKEKKFLSKNEHTLIKGSIFKELPTTSVIATWMKDIQNNAWCEFIWTGDSRGYILDDKGMHQITKDDVFTDEDAFSDLINDAKLKSVINADDDFELHNKILPLNKPSVIIVATDGAFGYLHSPMHFEYMILNSLQKSDSMEEWESKISESVSKVTGDDFSFLAIVYGLRDFKSIKKYFEERYKYIYNMLKDALNYEELQNLWDEYKKDYYHYDTER